MLIVLECSDYSKLNGRDLNDRVFLGDGLINRVARRASEVVRWGLETW